MELKQLRELAKTQGFWAENKPPVTFNSLSLPQGFLWNEQVWRKVSTTSARSVLDWNLELEFSESELVLAIEPDRSTPRIFNSTPKIRSFTL